MGQEDKYLYGVNEDGWSEKYGEDYVRPRPLTAEEKERLFQEADEEAKVYNEPVETSPLRFRPEQPTQPVPEPQQPVPEPQPKSQPTQGESVSGQTPPPTTSGATDPYAQTRLAQQEEMKSWRQMLIDSHKKREEERKKRLRNERILGIGKALGDLLGAAFAGAGSLRGNYAAVVPQAQAPKSVERVQQLINEGVVNAKDYDKMMQTLAMQEGKDKIALAKAMDEIGIKQSQLAEQREYEAKKLAEQREYEEKKLEKAHERQKELIGLRHTNTITQLRKRGENAVAVALARSGDKNKGKATFSEADMMILGATLPEEIEETTQKPDKYGEMQTITKTKPYKANVNDMKVELARQKELMKRYNLNPEKEEDKEKWAIAMSSIDELATRLPQASKEQLLAALVSGLTGEEIITMWNARFGNNGTK